MYIYIVGRAGALLWPSRFGRAAAGVGSKGGRRRILGAFLSHRIVPEHTSPPNSQCGPSVGGPTAAGRPAVRLFRKNADSTARATNSLELQEVHAPIVCADHSESLQACGENRETQAMRALTARPCCLERTWILRRGRPALCTRRGNTRCGTLM